MLKLIKSNLKYKKKNNHSIILPFLLSYFDLQISNEAEPIIHYLSDILILSLVLIICFTNIFGYLSAIICIKFYKINDKYPKINKFLSYF